MHAVTYTKNYLRSFSPRTQIIASAIFLAVSSPPLFFLLVESGESYKTLCSTKSLSQCYSWLEETKKQDKANEAFFRQAALTQQAETKAHQDMLSRTRLAEATWNQPYIEPITIGYSDHSIIRVPVCPHNEKPYVGMRFDKPTLNVGLTVGERNGYWLLDVFRRTDTGIVFPRFQIRGTLTIGCLSIPAKIQGGKP